MSDRRPEPARVGVVGAGADGAVVDAVSAGGGDPVVDGAAAVVESDPAAVVAVGERALVDLAVAGVEAPVLPVSVSDSVRPVPASAVESAVGSVLAGEFEAVAYPLLTVEGHAVEDPPHALFDLALVAGEPARISEYTVSSAGDRIATLRADGVVVATPMGSDGYAAAAGGLTVEVGAGTVVVPVAPFSTSAKMRVIDPVPETPLTVSVEREGAVAVVVDGVRRGAVDRGADLRIERVDSLDVVTPPRTENF